jgi:class 3 adenylate cyclase
VIARPDTSASIGARVAKAAQPNEVLVSSTVRDLVAGSGLHFSQRGSAELKGVPGEWQLYAVEVGD